MADAVRAAGADHNGYTRWRSSLLRSQKGAASVLSPAGLEAAVMRLAQTNPEYIVMGA